MSRKSRAWGISRWIIFGWLALPSLAVAAPASGTFLEEIQTVQLPAGERAMTGTNTVSVPFTRVDVLVDNGVAKQRFLQVFHNHSQTNQGFAFSLPLLADTTITGFNLWDQGKRYAGAITERERAEDIYKKVTGDEAPTMNRDPGLVRQTGNVYEMRVFPIVPGEDKQVELFSHRRLDMTDGRFVLNLPLAQMTQPRDARHASVRSAVTEASIWLRDELPITAVEVTGAEVREERLDERQRILRLRWENQAVANVEIRYTVAVPAGGRVTPWSVAVKGENYFLLRVLSPATLPALAPQAVPSRRHFYMAVWQPVRSAKEHPELAEEWNPMQDGAMEIAAFLTLSALNPQDTFQGAYRSSTTNQRKDGLPTAVTTNTYVVADFEKAFGEAFGDVRGTTKTAPPDVVAHLTRALEDPNCRLVYLFIGELPATDIRVLADLVERHADREFILVTEVAPLPVELRNRANVSHYSLRGGWSAVRHKIESPRQVLMPSNFFAGELGLPVGALALLWEKLPNFSNQWPQLRATGPVALRDVQVFGDGVTGFDDGRTRTNRAGNADVVWLSGRFTGNGELTFELELPEQLALFRKGNRPTQSRRITGQVPLQPGDGQQRWVGALHARRVAEVLGAEMQQLRRRPTGRGQLLPAGNPARSDRLAELGRKVAQLSRTFGFISSETAFIALPPELQRQYGLTPQETIAQQSYHAAIPIVPEPAGWQLVLLGLALLAALHPRQRWRPN